MWANELGAGADVVELLVIFDEDFERVLRPVMEKQWMEKKSALLALDYFKFFTRDQVINACKLCLLRQFEPLETIYYEDKGQLSYVHFVISGECMILQCLEMMVSQRKGKKTFDLIEVSKENAAQLFHGLSNTELLKILRNEDISTGEDTYNIDRLIESQDDNDVSNATAQSRNLRNTDMKSIEYKCGLRQTTPVTSTTSSCPAESNKIGQKLQKFYANDDLLIENEYDNIRYSSDESEMQNECVEENADDEEFLSENASNLMNRMLQRDKRTTDGAKTKGKCRQNNSKKHSKAPENEDVFVGDNLMANVNPSTEQRNLGLKNEDTGDGERVESKLGRQPSIFPKTQQSSVRNPVTLQASSLSKPKRVSGNLENHFIDVGSLTFGGIFGLGESLERRVIMARTAVQCLMIPRFWLLEKKQNPGNIWQRRRFYLDATIPKRETLFKDFLSTRQWQKFKNDLVQSRLDPNSISNPTKIQDIPIICRIVEADDD